MSAEYLAMERAAATKHELWEGEVFAMAGASLAHNLIVGNLTRVLGNLLLEGPCLVLNSDMKVHVPGRDRRRRCLSQGRVLAAGLTGI